MQSPRLLTLTSTLAMLAAVPALADLTAEQVLEDQIRQMQAYGLTAKVTSQTRNGNDLIVEGFSAGAVLPEGTLRVDVGGATFREMGDGSVQIIYPQTIPVRVLATFEDEDPVDVELSLSQSDMKTLVTGIPEEIRYDFTAASIALGEMQVKLPDDTADLGMILNMQASGVKAVSEFTGGGTIRDYDATFDVETLSGTIDIDIPDEGPFNLAFEAQDMNGVYGGTVAPQTFANSFADAIAAGNTTEGQASHGPLTYTVAVDGEDGSFELAAAVSSGTFDIKTDTDGINYANLAKDVTLSIGGSAIPLPPLTFKMAETGGRVLMPVVPSDDVQDFAMQLNLTGLEIDQILWGMFDPTGQIPRDPANLVVDIAGTGKMTQDIFAPEFAEEMTGTPGELESLNINQLLLTLAGTELTGEGAFTFNNEGDVPMPVGAIDLMLTGGNGLLDTLVNMGLLPAEQAMGARMMMGLFTRPTDVPDTLVSRIMVREDGSVLANGQRIR